MKTYLYRMKKKLRLIFDLYIAYQSPVDELTVGLMNEQNRDDWVVSKLKGIKSESNILDAGAGELRYKKYCSHLNYTSQDICQYDGKGDGKGIHLGEWDTTKVDLVCDINNIPKEDSVFDVILCTEVIEHLPNPITALEEFKRLLSVGGKLIITAPFCSLTHQSPYHYSTGFSRYYYNYHLKQLGFEIKEIESNGNFFEYLAQEIRRIRRMADNYSNQKFTKKDIISSKIMLQLLNRFSQNDNGSDEMLCFGYHILAIKR